MNTLVVNVVLLGIARTLPTASTCSNVKNPVVDAKHVDNCAAPAKINVQYATVSFEGINPTGIGVLIVDELFHATTLGNATIEHLTVLGPNRDHLTVPTPVGGPAAVPVNV